MAITIIGNTLKPGFVRKGIKGKFLHGTMRKFGNRKGIVQNVIRQ